MFKIVFLTFIFLSLYEKAFAINQRAALCDEAEYLTTRLCVGQDPSCSTVAQDCVTKCTAAVTTAGSITERRYIERQVNSCQQYTGQNNCSAAYEALLACPSNCQTQFDACVSQCSTLPAVEATEYRRRCEANRNGNGTEATPPVEEQVPVDPTAADDNAVSADNNSTTDPAATGTPNPAVQPTPEIVATDSGNGALANTNPGDINFTPNIGGSIQAQSPQIESGGYAGTASGTDDVFAGEQVGGPPPNNNSGANPTGGGGPMGNAGMPMGAGGAAGARPPGATAANNRRGGPARNGAAEYLSRHSPFAYQTPPGGTANGGGAKGNRTVANKKGTPPRYNKKENDGRDALNRLFGEGMAPSSYRRNPYGAGSGKNCLDSVFCPVEVFYNKIERFPNHEINPDSF